MSNIWIKLGCISNVCYSNSTLNRALDVIDVFNGQSLESYLRLPDSSGSVARLSLINGTQWATLGGGVKDFGLVLGKPPSTSSDTTLKEALKSFNTSVSLTYKQIYSFWN